MVLTIAAGGTILLENPSNSLIALHDRYIWFVRLLATHNIFVAQPVKDKFVCFPIRLVYPCMRANQDLPGELLDAQAWWYDLEAHMDVGDHTPPPRA